MIPRATPRVSGRGYTVWNNRRIIIDGTRGIYTRKVGKNVHMRQRRALKIKKLLCSNSSLESLCPCQPGMAKQSGSAARPGRSRPAGDKHSLQVLLGVRRVLGF